MIAAASDRLAGLFGADEPATEIALATALDVLQNRRRRLVIRRLSAFESGETRRVRDLAHEVAALEQDVDPAELSWTESKSAYVGLLETHLDKLAAANIVEYDEDEHPKQIRRGAEVEPFIEFLDSGQEYFVADGGAR